MKVHSREPLHMEPALDIPKAPPKFVVRYVGFEAVEGGRRLKFWVKTAERVTMEVTLDVMSAAFINQPEVSLQDVAPMAYEKIGALLAAEGRLDPCQLCLTDEDISQYRTRHRSAQREAAFNRGRERDTAA
jgi:hypothetical protein